MFSRRAVSDTLRSHNSNTRWICRRGDSAVASQHDDAGILARAAQGLDHVQSVAVFQSQVHHGVGGGFGTADGKPLGHGFGHDRIEAAFFHGARQPVAEGRVVIDDQQ